MLVVNLAHAVPVCTVSDIVYRGDGTPAQGTLVISWPAFTSAENKAVAAGSMSVAIGAGGAVTLALVPNEGGDPANTYYKVVYKLNDGSTSIEYWSVPNVIATTISAIRSKIVPANVAMQVASRQYVDTAIAGNIGNAVKIHGRDIDPAAPTASGDKLVWNTAAARFKTQSNPWIDVRDYGADCNFNTSSDTALADALAAATNG
ncbi:MAG TPA: hypothetical protein VGQ71_07315, partial [Terriglobales bacterium]|nr:hypothetical protein [Terriglobales bacterium]